MDNLPIGTIKTINKGFIEDSIQRYPILKKDKPLRYLYCHIAHQLAKGQDSVALPAKLLANLEGKVKQYKSKNYVAERFLNKFSKEVLPLKFKTFKIKGNQGNLSCQYSYKLSKSREAIINIPNIHLLKNPYSKDKVFIDTLKPFQRGKVSPYHRNKYSTILSKQSEDITFKIPEPHSDIEKLQRDLLDLLNNYPSRKFTSLVKQNLQEAVERAEQLSQPSVRDYTLRLLDDISLTPKPFYSASEGGMTTRIFSNNSFLNLPRKIREVFVKDCLKVDIKSSQLAIIANWWNVPEVTSFLKKGNSIWDELFHWMDMDHFDEDTKDLIKSKCLKKFLYSLIYGMGRRKLKSNFRSAVLEILPGFKVDRFKIIKGGRLRRFSLGDQITSHPFMKRLLTRRDSIKSYIKRKGGLQSPKGWLPLKDNTPQSLMACLAQQVEMIAMKPIIDELLKADEDRHKTSNKLNRFFCVAWLHDGLYIKLADAKRKTGMWIQRLEAKSNYILESMGLQYDIEASYSYQAYKHKAR